MLYELTIENELEDFIYAISLVKDPAIEKNFIYFNKNEVKFSSVDTEKRLVMGPLLVPEKQILRVDGEGKPYWVMFKAPTIKRLAEMYLERKYNDSATLEHDGKVDGVTLVESWVVESRTKDKSALYNLNVPVGTWMGVMKINNDEIWEDYVKTGAVKGFSIEGVFTHKPMHEFGLFDKPIHELSEVEAEVVLSEIHKVLFEQPSIVSSYPGQAASGSIIAPALLVSEGNLDVLGYETKNFEICPGALGLFTHLLEMPQEEDTVGMVRSAAVVADTIFRIEKEVISAGTATSSQLSEVQILVKDFKDIIHELDEEFGMVHDVSFMDGHIDVVKSYL